jgi:hypothetical protein
MKPVFAALLIGMLGYASVQPASAAAAGKFEEKVLYSGSSGIRVGDFRGF